MGIRKSEYADSGKRKHLCRFQHPENKVQKEIEWDEVKKLFEPHARLYCIFDGCGKFREVPVRFKICKHCGDIKK